MRSILNFSGKDGVEFFLRNKAIMVSISSVDELLKLLVPNIFSEFLGNSAKIFYGDVSGTLIIEKSENFVDIGTGVLVIDSLGHEGKPLSEVDSSTSVSVHIGKHLENSSAFGFKTKGSHGSFKLFIVDEIPLISTDPP